MCSDRRMSPDAPYRIEMTGEARQSFIENYDRLDHAATAQKGAMEAILSKMAGITGRIALVLHLADFASQNCGEEFPGEIPPIDKDTMDNAIQITQWFIGQAERVLTVLCPQGYAHIDREAAAIVGVIQAKGEITKDELHNLQVFKTAEHPAEMIEEKLSGLKQRGIIVSEFVKNPKGGRGKEVYRLVSATVGGGTPENADDNEGSISTASESE